MAVKTKEIVHYADQYLSAPIACGLIPKPDTWMSHNIDDVTCSDCIMALARKGAGYVK